MRTRPRHTGARLGTTRLAQAALVALFSLVAGCWRSHGFEGERDASALDAGRMDAGPETCNGADDDGDGVVDEGIPEQRCGIGGCAVSVPGCQRGAVPACVPGAPAVETCGFGDQDCDGRTDEGVGFGALEEPVLIGPADEGSQRNTDVVATSDGALSFQRRDGTPYVVPLDANAIPAGDPVTLLDRSAFHGAIATRGAADRVGLVFCADTMDRVGQLTSRWFDAGSEALGPEAGRPMTATCSDGESDLIWSGERFVIGWMDPLAPAFQPFVEIADRDLASLAVRELREPGYVGDYTVPPRLGRNAERILVAWGVRDARDELRSELRLQVYDARGEEVGARVTFGPPPPRGGAAHTEWGEVVAVPRADGFTIYSGNQVPEGGVLVVHLAADGAPLAPPTYVDGIDVQVGHIRAAPIPGGGAYLAVAGFSRGELVRVDPSGAIIDRFILDVPGPHTPVTPEVAVNDEGRVFVTWTRLPNVGRNAVYVRGYGCGS